MGSEREAPAVTRGPTCTNTGIPRRCISEYALWKRILTSPEALWSFCRFQAFEISPPPMMTVMPMITTTAINSIRLNPLRPSGRSACDGGQTSEGEWFFIEKIRPLKARFVPDLALESQTTPKRHVTPATARIHESLQHVELTLFVTLPVQRRTIPARGANRRARLR